MEAIRRSNAPKAYDCHARYRGAAKTRQPGGAEMDTNDKAGHGDATAAGEPNGSEPAGQSPLRDQAGRARELGERWIGQLQEMIDQAGRQAGPVLRDVAAKAAELAAVAAENAGPGA